eukprot:757741-Pleurochrysis_carterae.AAC.1
MPRPVRFISAPICLRLFQDAVSARLSASVGMGPREPDAWLTCACADCAAFPMPLGRRRTRVGGSVSAHTFLSPATPRARSSRVSRGASGVEVRGAR